MINKYQVSSIKYQVNRAFTLIEMLVVISLIGILAGLALISFSSSQKQARDVNRKSDLKQYQTALESYANLSNGLYPIRTTTTSITTLCADLNLQINPDISCFNDPKYSSDPTNFEYKYISDGTGTAGSASASKFVIWAKLENNTTTPYWVVCSNGVSGTVSSQPSSSTCPI